MTGDYRLERKMGDHRINLKITFEMHGHKEELDAWWNFSAGDVPGVDHRAIEWLQAQYEKAMDSYLDDQFSDETRRQAEIERTEREILERLKDKYETAG